MPLAGSKDSRCYVCGSNNPPGLRVGVTRDGAQGSQARYTAHREHVGWNGILHGGVTFALMDEALGWSLYYQDLAAVTARVETHAEIRAGSSEAALLAQANATMCLIDQRIEFEASSNGKEPNRVSV